MNDDQASAKKGVLGRLKLTINDKKKKDLAKSSFVAFSLKIISAAVGFILNIALARALGAEGAGMYYLALSVTTISSVISRYGLDNSLIRFVAASASQGKWEEVAGLYKNGVLISGGASLIVTCVLETIAPLLAKYIFSNPELSSQIRFMALSIVPFSLLNIHAALFIAMKKIRDAMVVQGLCLPIITLFLLFPFAKHAGALGAAGAYVLSCISVCGFAAWLWRKSMPQLKNVRSAFNFEEIKSTSGRMYAIALTNLVVDMTDVLMVGAFLNSTAVGIYSAASRTVMLNSIILLATNAVVGPLFSSLWTNNKKQELNSMARLTTRGMALLALPIFFAVMFFPRLILSAFGKDFIAGIDVLRILELGQFIALATGPVAYLLMMTGHEAFHRNNIILCAVINMALNAILIPILGMIGAAIATTSALTLKNGLALIYVRKKLGIRIFL